MFSLCFISENSPRLRPNRKRSFEDMMISSDEEKNLKAKRRSKIERKRQARRNMTEEQRTRYNEAARIRMQRLREKKKVECKTRSHKKVTAAQRQKWKEEKRAQRDKMTDLQKEEKRQKRREAYHLMKLKKGQNVTFDPNPSEFADQICNIILNASPRKKNALRKNGVSWGPATKLGKTTLSLLNNHMKMLKGDRKSSSRQKMRNLVQSISGGEEDEKLRKWLNVRYATWTKYSSSSSDERKTRSDHVSEKLSAKVQQFYSKNATIISGKKSGG